MPTGVIIALVIVLVLGLGGTGAFYALSGGTFDAAVLANILTKATEAPTQEATKAPTEPPTEGIPELAAKISQQELSVTEGKTAQISAEITNSKKTGNIRYTTSDENIAAVNSQGVVTPMSKGECQVGAYVEGYDTTIKNFTVKVSDDRVDDITALNSYLYSLKPTEEYTYAKTKKGKAKISGCKIGDFNEDGSYELFITYKLSENFQKARVVTYYNGTAYVSETEKSYSEIVNSGYSSYVEEIYTDSQGNFDIIAEYSKATANYTEKTTLLYNTAGNTASKKAEYYSKEPAKLGDMAKKAVYKIDGKKKTRDDYTSQYTSLKTSRTLFNDYVSVIERLSEGNYTKAVLPSDLGAAYYNRIKWTSSDSAVATVSSSGIITGEGKAGSCNITGVISGLEGTFCRMSIEVSDVSDEFASYIESIKDDYIIGEAGNKMKLYGYYVGDIDNDGVTDLLLYYTGGNGCQLNMMHFVGTNPSVQTIKSATTENGVNCMLELYTDSMSNNETVLYVANVSKSGTRFETSFSYESYQNGEFVENSSEYTFINDTASGKKEFKVGGEKVEESSFNDMLNRYRKLGDWTLIK